MNTKNIITFWCTILLNGGALQAQTPAAEFVVRNNELNRAISFASFQIPVELQGLSLAAQEAGGQAIPLQASEDRWIHVRLDDLSANEERIIRLRQVPSQPVPESSITATRAENRVEFRAGEKRVLNYQAEPGPLPRERIDESYLRGGYLHPVWSPQGNRVTDDYPRDHLHHHGIWFPWTKTEFEGREPDFWNMGAKSGRVEFVQLDGFKSGPVFGELNTAHRFVDLLVPDGKTALNETWNVKVYNVPADSDIWIFDLESTQTCATDSPLILPEYRYGGLGFRGHGDWNGAGNAYFLTSNGETDRVKGHATRANWCYIGGDSDGQRTGTVIMCHPENFRAPQPMRIHPTEPFFCFAPQQAGDMSIEPGQAYVSKYRFLVIDGEPDADEINAYWNDYANPLVIEKR